MQPQAESLRVAGEFRSGCLERGVKLDLGEGLFLVGEDGVGQTREFDVQPARSIRICTRVCPNLQQTCNDFWWGSPASYRKEW
jgi:hypothetical protein